MKNKGKETSESFKQTGRVLVFPGRDLKVVLPFGSGLSAKTCAFELIGSGKALRVMAVPNGKSSSPIQVSPNYCERSDIRLRNGAKCEAKFWVVQTDLDRLRARQLIEREHYLMPTARGLFLACGIESKSASLRIIGVAVLDTLYHGNPKDGRSLFATDTLNSQQWMNWSRDKIVDKLRLAWASRFAVSSDYQGCGIGTRLAKHLKTVARRFRWPAANFIEVITTEAKNSQYSGNFLVSAGYIRAERPMRSSPLRLMNRKTGYLEPVAANKYYYYADVRDEK
jgi:GNAT superfamily N-acetyltransferase